MGSKTIFGNAEVISCDFIADNIVSLVFESTAIADSVRPGQFVNIACGHSRIMRRPISVCAAEGTAVRIVFEVKGDGTRWLSGRKPGSVIDAAGPLGNGFDCGTLAGKKVAIVGGGIGAPPVLFAASRIPGSVCLLGFASESRAVLLPEFEKVSAELEIASDDGSIGKKGLITELLDSRLANESFDMVLACGPKAMLKAVYAISERHGVPCMVSVEQRMACGVGACLVCSCAAKGGYKRVCRDGPVFDASEVLWDEA